MLPDIRKGDKMKKIETMFDIDEFMGEKFPMKFDRYLGNRNIYKLTDEEAELLKWVNVSDNTSLEILENERNKSLNENKEAIIKSYKMQLEALSEVQEDLSIAFENCEIDYEKYLEGMCRTNDRIMEILDELKIESEYIPF